MNDLSYIFNSVKHYKKHYLALFLATVLTSAILTGALLVGDSVKYSLRKNVDQRLGEIGFALETNDRFVRKELATEINNQLNLASSAILKLNGIAIHPIHQIRNNQVQILGVDQSFWELSNVNSLELGKKEVILSESLANELNAEIGDRILLKIQKQSIMPLNAPFSGNEENSISLRLKLVNILSRDQLGGFSLKNQQAEVYNAFLDYNYLSAEMGIETLSNLIVSKFSDQINAQDLNQALKNSFQLKDASLQLDVVADSNIIQLTSDRVFIEKSIESSVEEIDLPKQAVLTYFVNSISCSQKETPYSFVSAIAPSEYDLKSTEILINNWLAEDLGVSVDDTLKLKYFTIGPLRKLSEETETFIVKDVLDIESPLFSEILMPDFPGLSTAGNCSDWEADIPINLEKIRDKDENYWDEYRGTPKAFIQLEKAQYLWNNPFGQLTAFNFSTNNISKDNLEKKLIEKLNPFDFGFTFQKVREKGLNAANNGVDFGQLFLSLSFFVILSAIILLVLIFLLHQKIRLEETGLLLASGFPGKKIILYRLLESLPILILGSIIGGILGIAYNSAMIWGLNHVWNQAVHTQILESFINPSSIFVGILASTIISFFSIVFVIRNQITKSVYASIRGINQFYYSKGKTHLWFAIICLLIAIGLLTFSMIYSIEKSSSLMLASGFLMLLSLVFFVSHYWNVLSTKNHQLNSLTKLSIINARRNKSRSLAVVVLLAIGSFTILVTGANRKTFNGSIDQRSSGTGGFMFWAENSIPILQDLNSKEAQIELGLNIDKTLNSTWFVQLKNISGDDASCLNLNQVQQPTLLGVNPSIFDSLAAFSFAKTIQKTKNPWLLLNDSLGENILPAIADQTVIQWGLIKNIGDTLNYVSESGEMIKIVLVGGLNASIFQGNLLISEENLRKHYPSSAGSKHMLIDCPKENKNEIKRILSNQLSDFGIEITDNQQRLSSFYSVTNTYLNIFMILGGLGVLIGTLGLGLILYRNILERKEELALMRSLGFSIAKIQSHIFNENLILVVLGIFFGLVSALIGILPSLVSNAFAISGTFMIYLIIFIFISALFWIFVSLKSVMKQIGI